MALSDAEWASEFEPIQRSNPPRPGRALHEAKIPMTGPGADSTVRATPDGAGIFGGSHAPAGEAEPSRPIGHVGCAGSRIVLLPALHEAMAAGPGRRRTPRE